MKLIKEVRKLYDNSLKSPDYIFEEKKQEIINLIKDSAIKSRTTIEYKVLDADDLIIENLINYFKKEEFKVEFFKTNTFGNFLSIGW